MKNRTMVAICISAAFAVVFLAIMPALPPENRMASLKAGIVGGMVLFAVIAGTTPTGTGRD